MKKFILWTVFFVVFTGACTPRYGTGDRESLAEKGDVSSDVSSEKQGAGTFYDFIDIPVPHEMKLDPDSSLLFETADLKAGRICFKGWVDPVSVFDFFLKYMPKENWKLRSYYKYGVYLMVFEKPDRDCIINIHKKTLNTWLEIWVTPRLVEMEVPPKE